MRRARLIALFWLLFVCFVTCRVEPAGGPPYKLVLVLSVDQMRYDYLTRFQDLFHGGFHKLLTEGAVFSNANLHHACSETGPGHSVILTGRYGAHSGIVANAWYDSFLKKDVNCVADDLQKSVGGEGRAASPVNLIGYTIGDALKQNSPESRVIGISLKDRSAILMAGHRADAAFWYSFHDGKFITSTYYMNRLPEWLQKWNDNRFPERYAGKKWERLINDPKLYDRYAGPDAIEGESDRKDIVFPHLLPMEPSALHENFAEFPFADDMTLSAALEVVKAYNLGNGPAVDLLAIGFSTTDMIGHSYGPDSHEILDQLLRLDRTLGTLFQELDARIGPGKVLVVLTADHGVMPLVENLEAKGIAAKRVPPDALEISVNKALAAQYPGVEDLIAGYMAPNFYLNLDSIEKHKLKREDVESVISRTLMATGYVERVYLHSDFAKNAAAGDPYFDLLRNSFFAPRSPHLTVLLKKYIYMDDYPGGTGHGTLYDYDRHIPILFMGNGIKAGTNAQECSSASIAPTVAALLGLTFPHEPDAVVLPVFANPKN